VATLWDLPDPEAERELGMPVAEEAASPMTKEDFAKLMKLLAERNPAIKAAQEERRAAMESALLRRVLGLDHA
jgi:hypothetical protein